ncbi:GlxA family transcriptional regulator [Streptomyces sp. NPDC054766]|uniref:GlxA family transcriptional regulator n=1 Tax=Streptomyces rhizosphaerihabitans TaxID=1266770 RepID=UPI0021C12F82|nr:GlxA family transcriptional regulator [Streptomyces rhizosphaerihabitans]MCT9006858.1 GlxA family transcriptional regulator [Streptomyces rhizosphaerihabitans]
MAERRVVVLVYAGAMALDITGPIEVFDVANRLLPPAAAPYRIEVVSADAPLVRTSSGLIVGALPLEAGQGPVDTLLVPGGWSVGEALRDRALVSWIGAAAARSRRVTSVCGGSFLLAEAGLLDGRRATTHWAYSEAMACRYPAVTVDAEPIFVWDGPFVTSAGVSTGIDMALALVEADHGAALALETARFLVLFLKRHGGQSQFSAMLDAQLADHPPIRTAQEWILENLHNPLPVAEMAQRANMSPRNFARVFRREVGTTPGQYVERTRISRARELLETTDLPIGQIAGRCGFGAPETFFRSFGRTLGVTPKEYRHRFQVITSSGLIDRRHETDRSPA